MNELSQKIGRNIYNEIVIKEMRDIEDGLKSPLEEGESQLHAFFNRLNENDQSIFLRAIRTALTDGASTVLGIFDGSTPLGPEKDYLDFSMSIDNTEIQFLHDYFIEAHEENNKNAIGLVINKKN